MTVIVDGRVFGGEATGIGRVARGLLDGGRASGLDAVVLAPRGTTDPRVDRTFRAGAPRIWEQLVLPAVAGRRTVLSFANTAPLLARHSVVFVHDRAPQVEPAWFAPHMRWYARTVALGARRADHVLVPSESVRQELLSALRLDPARVTVVRPAVELSPASNTDVDELRAKHRLDRPYVVLVGWADPRKDLATALAAHRIVHEDIGHDLVLIGGDHRNFAPVIAPPDPSVRVLGRVDDRAIRAALTGAAVLLHPSRYEGFGLPPLEAWACGTPALIGDVPAVREATQELAPLLPLADVEAWATALREALTTPLPVPSPAPWTWTDAGRVLVRALGCSS